jgi:hypothetical protein
MFEYTKVQYYKVTYFVPVLFSDVVFTGAVGELSAVGVGMLLSLSISYCLLGSSCTRVLKIALGLTVFLSFI